MDKLKPVPVPACNGVMLDVAFCVLTRYVDDQVSTALEFKEILIIQKPGETVSSVKNEVAVAVGTDIEPDRVLTKLDH